MKIKFILKSGADFTIDCDNIVFKTDGELNLVSYEIDALRISDGFVKPTFLDIKEVAAILRLTS